jgi:hypothetical protein
MIYYQFDAEYLYSGQRKAQIDPKESQIAGQTVYMLPGRFETTIAPPPASVEQIPKWNGSEWNVIPDHRGQTWFEGHGKPIIIKRVGDPRSFVPPLMDSEPDPPAPTHSDMIANVQLERARRLSLGFAYDFGDERGIHQIGTTPEDMIGWRDVIDYANALIDSGDTSTQINIVTDTGATAVTAPEWQVVMLEAASVRQKLWAASFALQAMQPIPGDYANDIYWS